MSFFCGLFRSRDAPQNRTAGSGYTFFFGSSTSGKAVTERSAMQMTAVYSCVRILAEAVAGLPLNLYREVIALYPLMPNKMTVDRDERGQLYYSYQRGTDEAIRDKNLTGILRPSDVPHIPGLGFDWLVGYSPIAMAKNAIGMALPARSMGLSSSPTARPRAASWNTLAPSRTHSVCGAGSPLSAAAAMQIRSLSWRRA